ncbi:helix-turn-helix domain-containing protein [Microbacterium sp.]|uniref:helix-turn-helix domain-containing protein n=1 Tax=Microbacterium sp. TaxID=51671 RepID=UPI003A953819
MVDSTGEDVDVSGYVRRARRLADASQRELAAHVGVSQSAVMRIENGGEVGVRQFSRILGTAGLRLAVVDEGGHEVTPMPADVFRDSAGRRHPAHLDVHARPETPTMKMLFRAADPVPAGGSWYHRRPERDRLRERAGRGGRDEQLSVSAAAARRRMGSPCAAPPGTPVVGGAAPVRTVGQRRGPGRGRGGHGDRVRA